MISNVNNKYKTVMCKHFEQNGYCHLGAKCHFAHGPEELRSINDPMPSTRSTSTNTSRGPGNHSKFSGNPNASNYKTVQCRYFEQGHCRYGEECSFAHGGQEVRAGNPSTPQHAQHTQHSLQGMQMNNPMISGMYDPNIQNQIAQQQIVYLITQMENYHAKDEDVIAKLSEAAKLNTAGSVQSAASMEIINRSDKSKEDNDNYNSFVQGIQSYGSAMYAQMQTQYMQPAIGSMYGYNPQPMMTGHYGGVPHNVGAQYNGGYNMGQSHPYSRYNKRNGHGKHQGQGDSDDNGDGSNNNGDGMTEVTNKLGGVQISQNQGYQQPYHNK